MKARFDGTCSACEDYIEEGDDIVCQDGEWVHVRCDEPVLADEIQARCLVCADLLVDGRCRNCEA